MVGLKERGIFGVILAWGWGGMGTAWADLVLPGENRPPDTREEAPAPEDFLRLPVPAASTSKRPSPASEPSPPGQRGEEREEKSPAVEQDEVYHRNVSPDTSVPRSVTGVHEHEAPEAWEAVWVFTSDLLDVAAGGVATGWAPVALAEFIGVIRGDVLGWWRGGEAAVHLAYAMGDSPSNGVGDVSGVSGIDAGDATGLFVWDAWLQQSLPWWETRLRVGVVDFNNDFYLSDYANLFLNGGFGMGSELGVEGGVHTYPATGPGMEAFVRPWSGLYLQGGYWRGRPSSEGVLRNGHGGDFLSVEAGWREGVSGTAGYLKLALGMWRDTNRLDHWAGEDWQAEGRSGPAFAAAPQAGNNGLYLVAETAVGRRLGLFFKAGWADPSRNRYALSYAVGGQTQGVLPGRPQDTFGVGILQTRQSDQFLAYAQGEGQPYFRAETVYEITYAAEVARGVFVQPDFQYVLQPGMDVGVGNAIVLGVRFQALW